MFLIWKINLCYLFISLEQSSIVKMLAVTVLFFLILLILGVRKSIILKRENERLSKSSPVLEDETKKPYKDFTEGHMYDNH